MTNDTIYTLKTVEVTEFTAGDRAPIIRIAGGTDNYFNSHKSAHTMLTAWITSDYEDALKEVFCDDDINPALTVRKWSAQLIHENETFETIVIKTIYITALELLK